MKTTAQGTKVPYPPSWVDRFGGWMVRLPGSFWLFYVVTSLITVLVVNAALWIEGSIPVGSIDIFTSAFGLFVFYWLALYCYLSQGASQALRIFRPLMDADDGEISRVDYELTTLPRNIGWWVIPIGIIFALVTVLGDPEPYGESIQPTPLLYSLDVVVTSLMTATFLALVIRSIRQLRMVSRLLAKANHINLLRLAPAQAFSGFTARTGIGMIFPLIIFYFLETWQYSAPRDPFGYAAVAVIAVGVFVLPVIGIKERIEEEKERALTEVTDLLKVTSERLHATVKGENEDGIKEADTAIEALVRERELLRKVPTWPWDPGTLRGFASTLLLPVFLWLVTHLLERIFS